MQTPPPDYQPGGWQQNQQGFPQQQPNFPQKPRTQTLNLEYNIAAGLCYIPFFLLNIILPIIFISSEPKTNKFVRFHAFQSLFMAIAGIVVGIGGYVAAIVSIFLAAFLGAATKVPALIGLGMVVFFVIIVGLVLFALGMLVSLIICLIKAFSGETWKVPVIGKFAEKYA